MPSASGPFKIALGALLLLGGSTLLLNGCDGSGSKRASLYQRLTGTWTAERLQETGSSSFDLTSRLEERYSSVRFVFRGGDDGRSYRVTGRLARQDTTVLLAEGPVALGGDRLLQMVRGFKNPSGRIRTITWRFRFQASRAIFRLPAGQQNGSRAFLSTLMPTRSWSGGQGLELQLAPDTK